MERNLDKKYSQLDPSLPHPRGSHESLANLESSPGHSVEGGTSSIKEARGFPASKDPSLFPSNQLACAPQCVLEHVTDIKPVRARLVVRNCATREKTGRWCPPILIRALVCFQVPSSTHRDVGCLQDAMISILEGDVVLPMGGHPPVRKSQDRTKSWFLW